MSSENDSFENDNNNSNNNSWVSYHKLILSELARLDKNITHLFKTVDILDTGIHKELSDAVADLKKTLASLDKALAILQTKAAFYGAIGGAVFAGIVELIVYSIAGRK
jgi:actin-related protein